MTIEKEFLSSKEVSGLLGVKLETLRYWRLTGVIPYHRFKGTIRFAKLDVEEFIRNSKEVKSR